MRSRIAIALVISVILANPASVQAAPKPIKPKVGNCFLLAPIEVPAPSVKKGALDCRKLHNVETYRVVTSPFKTDPNLQTPVDLFTRVTPICEAGLSGSKFFTNWSSKHPTPAEWKSGARWLRCDGLVITSESETVTYKSWKGKKLDFK